MRIIITGEDIFFENSNYELPVDKITCIVTKGNFTRCWGFLKEVFSEK
jgi:hypothetical protein